MTTATKLGIAELQRINRRMLRVQPLLHVILEKMRPYLRDEDDLHRVYGDIREVLVEAGVEIITDHVRSDLGLPPRGPDGWTDEEIVIMEHSRLAAMLAPIRMEVPK